MGCVLAAVALLMPRVVMLFIWALTGWFGRAYETWYWPVVGFLFLPYTTLAYMAAMLNNGAVSGWWLVLVVLAAMTDLGVWGGGSRSKRRARRKAR